MASPPIKNGLLKIILFLLVLSPVRCDVLDLFRESCPYNKFCTMDRLSNTTQEEVTSCCLDCFCDEACHAYGDCCPDIHSFEPMTSDNGTDDASCTSTVVTNKYLYTDHGLSLTRYPSYKVIDACPSDYIDVEGIAEKCKEDIYTADRKYIDAVLVSGHNNEIYKNNFCALCHGVTDAIRWYLRVLRCHDDFDSLRLSVSQVKPYIMENCILLSIRPQSLPLSSRLIPCNKDIVSECSDNATSTGLIEDEVIEGCLNGPFMPYSGDSGEIFMNVLCYMCNGYVIDEAIQDCFDILDGIARSPIGRLTNLMSTKEESRPEALCEESMIMDYHTKECRTLYCPPFEAVAYGTCQPIAKPDQLAVIIRTVFWNDANITVAQPRATYNESTRLSYARRLRAGFAELECPGISVYVKAYIERDINTLLHIEAETHLGINEKKCTLKDIGNFVKNQPPQPYSWLINDEMVEMKGQYNFIRNTNDDDNVVITYLVFDTVRGIGIYNTGEFIVCPYIEIDLDLYNTLLTTHSEPGDLTNLTTLTMTTETLDGMYGLSEDKLAVCVDQYPYATDTTNGASRSMLSCVYLVAQIIALFALKEYIEIFQGPAV